MSQARRRCPQCLYLRHPNDDRRAAPDTCPNCGRLYQKSQQQLERERRARSFRAHRMLQLTNCSQCREAVSFYAAQCPHCHHPLKGRFWTLTAAGALALLVPLGLALNRVLTPLPPSPLEGVSAERYAECVALSRAYEDTRLGRGVTAPETLTSYNRWHAECSRKALRDIGRLAGARLPASPQDWLTLYRNPAPAGALVSSPPLPAPRPAPRASETPVTGSAGR